MLIIKKEPNPYLLLTISDVFTNLSAGWFGAAFIVPTFSNLPITFNFSILITDLIFGIFCFVVAYILKKRGGKKQWI